jgi:hypothetical protein
MIKATSLETLFVEKTKYTPEISLNSETKCFHFIGKSYPENTFVFYAPTIEWLEQYFNLEVQGATIVNFEIIYFNSSSSKLFFDLFDLLEAASDKHSIEINWLYDKENETALEAGEDFQEDFETLNFNLVEK